jgi:hypothetical protein
MRCSMKARTLSSHERAHMRSVLPRERTTLCVRGGSTVFVVKPPGRSRGECRLAAFQAVFQVETDDIPSHGNRLPRWPLGCMLSA